MSNIQDALRILKELSLLPGRHCELQTAILELFCPHFTPDATVLYLSDLGNKPIIYEKEMLEKWGMPVTMHSKLPDTILYNEAKNLLFLIEAVTSHGALRPKRLLELESLLKNCTPKRIYISAFFDFAEYGQYALPIAWDTNVWIADIPEHMIHFNGDRYMGQHG